MSPMTMPKASEKARAAFQKLLPADPAVKTRPMFGNLSAFVNGNMFSGLFGEGLFVRVSDEDQAKIKKRGGRAFEVMPGRAMSGYAMLPEDWLSNPAGAREWIETALAFARKLPAKEKASGSGKTKAATGSGKAAAAGSKPRYRVR